MGVPAGSARVAFVFGVLFIITAGTVLGGVLFGVAAVVLAHRAEPSGRRVAGMWLGVVGLVWSALCVATFVGLMFVW